MIKLSENEHIISISRRHWWILAEKIIGSLFLALSPIIIYSLWNFFSPQTDLINKEVADKFVIFSISIFYTSLWLYFCLAFVDYYLDVWVVTNMRILDIEQVTLFNRTSSECYISNIQDIKVEVKGVLPTFLDYGDLHIQTSAEQKEFMFQQIANPSKIKNLVLDEYNKIKLVK